MELLQNNPFRILGLCSTSSIKEQTANKNKITAFVKVGKATKFPLDLEDRLGAVSRTPKAVQQAEAEINLPEDRALHALFWFAKVTPLDIAALFKIGAGDIAKAKEMLSRRDSWSADINLAVIAWMEGREREAFTQLSAMLQNESKYNGFRSAIGRIFSVEGERLFSLMVKSLEKCLGHQDFLFEASFKHVQEEDVDKLIEEIKKAIQEAKNADESSETQKKAAETLRKKTQNPLARLAELLGKNDPKMRLLTEDTVRQIRNCTIAYCNASKDTSRFDWAIGILNFSLSCNISEGLSEELNKDIKNLTNSRLLAPINEEIKHFENERTNDPRRMKAPIEQFLNVTQSLLFTLKESSGEEELCEETSSRIVFIALSAIIDGVSKAQEEYTTEMMGWRVSVGDALELMERLKYWSMDTSTRLRLETNIKSLREIQRRVEDSQKQISQSSSEDGVSNTIFWCIVIGFFIFLVCFYSR